MNNNNNKKNIMLAFMSGDQTWNRRIRLRTQATYEKKSKLINYIKYNASLYVRRPNMEAKNTLENTGHL